MHHIRNTIPELRAKIADGLVKYRTELAQLGDPIDEGVNPVSASFYEMLSNLPIFLLCRPAFCYRLSLNSVMNIAQCSMEMPAICHRKN